MSKPKIQIDGVVRVMTDDEYEQFLSDKTENEAQIEAAETKAVAKANVLEKLGLTADEAAALFG